jgi:NTE family protein
MMDITVAMGGGGAKGNAHIGVLRRLQKERYRIRAVAGTSFGGLIAAFFAAGYSPDAIEETFLRVDQSRLYGRGPAEGPSLLGLYNVNKWLDETLGGCTFADLRMPCALTAVDLTNGRELVINEGSVKDAVLSTIALPGLFPSVHMDEIELVDGGVTNPVPVSTARRLAPGLPVAAVILTRPLGQRTTRWKMPMPHLLPRIIAERINRTNFAQAMDIYMRAMEVSSRALAEYRLLAERPDVVIRPKVWHIDLLEVVDPRELALLGEEAVVEALPDLKRAMHWRARLGRFVGGGVR